MNLLPFIEFVQFQISHLFAGLNSACLQVLKFQVFISVIRIEFQTFHWSLWIFTEESEQYFLCSACWKQPGVYVVLQQPGQMVS